MLKPALALLSVLALAGCATMSEGTKAQVAIDTPGVSGADCRVTDGAGRLRGQVRSPGSVTLQKGKTNLTVTCTLDGYRTASQALTPSMAKKARLQMPSGYLVDAASGAMWTYPDSVSVPMTRG